MSNSLNRTIVNRQQRFALNGLSLARVIVLRGEDGTPSQVTGTLENSSHGGVRLCLDDCIPYGETATLRIFFDDTVGNQDGEIELEVTVCWSRPADDGKWTVGCNCASDLPEDVFAMFADRGEIERRRAARRPTRFVAMARWELSLGERPIEIIEASRTGFSFRAASMGSTGDRLLVRLTTIHGQEAIVAAELRWKANTDSGYLGGCSLINEEDFACLMPFVNDDKSDNPQRSRRPSKGKRARRPVNLAFAATVFLAFMSPSVLVLPLLQANRRERAITIDTYEPPEATAEIRLAQVNLDPPASGESASQVAPTPVPTRSIDVPTPVSLPPAVPQGQTHENEDVGQEIPRRDQRPVLNVTSPPTFVLDRRPSEFAEPEAKPTEEHTFDGPSAGDALVEDVPVERAPDEPNLTKTVRSAVPPDDVRVADAEIVTLEEAIADGPTDAPPPVAPVAIAPTVATPPDPGPNVAEPVSPDPITSESVLAPRVIPPATRRRAAAEFSRGRDALAAGDTSGALAAFAEAAASNPEVAVYQYHLALALHLTDQSEAANARIAEAARVEREHGVANWGQVMQRVQGRPRVWLERARRQALAGG